MTTGWAEWPLAVVQYQLFKVAGSGLTEMELKSEQRINEMA